MAVNATLRKRLHKPMNVAARPRPCYLLSNGAFCEGAYRALFIHELKKNTWAKEMKMLLRCQPPASRQSM